MTPDYAIKALLDDGSSHIAPDVVSRNEPSDTRSHPRLVRRVRAVSLGERKPLWERQRDALVRGAYRGLRQGLLEPSEGALEAFCRANMTAPTVSAYDAFTGGVVGRARAGVLLDDQAERCIASAVAKVLANFDPQRHRARQRDRAHARWGDPLTVEDLARVNGLSIRQQAGALGCSTRTVARLRERQRTSAASVM